MPIVEKIKILWLKYFVGYDKPENYWDSRWKADLSAERTTGKTAREELETIKSLMGKHSCRNILEIGCGKATLRNLPGYLGLDFSIEALKQSGLDTFIYADVTKRIPLPDKSQDAILSRYVLLHIPFSEIENAVEEISRVAKNVVILKEAYGPSKEHAQPHCFLHNLPELFRKFFDGMRARKLNVAESTIWSRLSRLRSKYDDCLRCAREIRSYQQKFFQRTGGKFNPLSRSGK